MIRICCKHCDTILWTYDESQLIPQSLTPTAIIITFLTTIDQAYSKIEHTSCGSNLLLQIDDVHGEGRAIYEYVEELKALNVIRINKDE